MDQAHEQNNAMVKDSGGAIGLTENPAALKRWMVSAPEQARLIEEFETQLDSEDSADFRSHKEGYSTQQSFQKQGAKPIKVCTVDTDVVVILVGIFLKIINQHPNIELWIA